MEGDLHRRWAPTCSSGRDGTRDRGGQMHPDLGDLHGAFDVQVLLFKDEQAEAPG